MLYNQIDGIAYDFADNDENMEELVRSTGFYEIIEVTVPTWKVAVVLNETMMYLNNNPLKFDSCPFVPVYWNYDPHLAQYDLRVRSLTRSMRDSQFLLNRRIILNHDISESSINSGWMRKENAVANPEDLRYSGQGKDIIIKDDYEMTDVQKIIPNAVPPSDMQLADQLADFIFRTSGVNQELMGMASDSNTGIQEMLRQGAGLVTLQKYFDQWDTALMLLGKLDQQIIQNNWSPAKIARIIGKEPNAEWLNKTFSKYDVQVAEGLNTTIQQQQQFRQMLDLNQLLGGIIPAKFILQYATIQGKDEIMKAVDEQQQQQSQMQNEQMMLEHTKIEAEIQKLQSGSIADAALARERDGRRDSNIGLFEERLSEITQNRSMALKNKVEALHKLLEVVSLYGESEAKNQFQDLQRLNENQTEEEDREKADAKIEANDIDFKQMISQKQKSQGMPGQQPQNTMGIQNTQEALV